MMNKKSVIMCLLTILMVGYCCFALPLTRRYASAERLTGIKVALTDPQSRFVSAADVEDAVGISRAALGTTLRDSFDLASLEKRLLASDKLETANVSLLADGRLLIEATPVVPVARVFDKSKPSYYINAEGKVIRAELRYHLDVPVVAGSFDSIYPAKRLLPLLDYIARHRDAGAMVATVTQEADGNIIIIPAVVGHVVNFGDTSMVADKFDRLKRFYRHVMPTKGWNTYDTIAVKWSGQVVGVRRNKEHRPGVVITEEDQSGVLDIDDNELLPSDSVITESSIQA